MHPHYAVQTAYVVPPSFRVPPQRPNQELIRSASFTGSCAMKA